jgi:hypothetical protein
MADPAQAPDLDQLLAFVVLRKAQAAKIAKELTEALDKLTALVDEAELDPAFSYEDYGFVWSPGKTSYEYPAEVLQIKKQLKDAEKKAQGNGSATAKTGAPFWTICPPKP